MKVWSRGSAFAALASLSALQLALAQRTADRTERIEVTGSRIATSDAESTSPIAIVSAEDIRVEGYQSIELMLNNLPQFVADQGNRVSNGATGTATINLRGLGARRTLALVNGRRLPAGSPSNLAPDVNQIPVALIERVDILTGGASAVYGSDAIAGVVNFILKERFEGVEGEAGYEFNGHRQKSAVQEALRASNFEVPGNKFDDGATTSVALTMGGNFAGDKGNATLHFRYLKAQALLESERDYSACALDLHAPTYQCAGSVAGYPGLFLDAASQELWTIAGDTGRTRPWSPLTGFYNYAPTNYYQRPSERYGLNGFASYDLHSRARAYVEFGFHDDHTIAQLAPGGLFGTGINVRYENPLLTDDWRTRLAFAGPDGTRATGPGTSAFVFIFRRNIEGGPRQAEIRHTSYREVLGIKGAIGPYWDFDTFIQAARVVYHQNFKNDFSSSRLSRALDVVVDPTTGAPICASVLNGSDASCVPYNPWTLGGVTPAALRYVQAPGFQTGSTSQEVIGATATHDLAAYGFRLPGAEKSVVLLLGLERRIDRLQLDTDLEFSTGDLAGEHAVLPVAGAVTVNEAFGEVRVPVFKSSSVNASYRYSKYSAGKSTSTYGLGFNSVAVQELRVRGSYQRAIRAPNITELFAPEFFEGGFENDPCAGPAPTRSLADCRHTGVSPAQYGHVLASPLGYPGLYGGSASLRPETAYTRTAGIILEPLARLTATIDYFDVRLDDTIGLGFPDVIFRECLNTGNPVFCNSVVRVAGSGMLDYVISKNQNVGSSRVTGLDVTVGYSTRFGNWGGFSIDALGTYLDHFKVEAYPGAPAYDCAGLAGLACDPAYPRWRHRIRATWKAPWNVDFAVTWRYIRSLKDASTDSHPLLSQDIGAIYRELKAMNYLDLAGSWSVSRSTTLRCGITNATDRDPPLGGGINGNAHAQVYDVLGRRVFVNLAVKF